MKTRAKAYIAVVSITGSLLGLKYILEYLLSVLCGETVVSLPLLLMPILLCGICRSLPIPIRDGEELDLSIISVLAVYLSHGVHAAVLTYAVSTLITFQPGAKGKGMRHLFCIGPQKVIFNDSTILLSIILPGLLVGRLFAWQPGDLSLPGVLAPMCVFSVFTFAVNGVLQVGLFCLNGMIEPRDMALMLVKLLPNVLAAIPLGFLLSFGYTSVTRIWFTLLLFLPLLLARYAWKQYLYTSTEQSRLIQVLINSIEAKDKYTQGHSERVANYSVQIARQMRLPSRQIGLIRQGAVLHDVGKIGIPDQILNKPARLTEEEMQQIRAHPAVGTRILEEVGLHPDVLRIVHSHHERYDGKGYPDGCPLSELDLSVRIVSVADAYDAMTSDRPYRARLPREVAIARLREGRGGQFDPDVVDALIRSLE